MKLWSWSTGDHGRNRIRVCERANRGALFLEWYEPRERGRRPAVRRRSLGHCDRERAKAQAEEFSLKRRADPEIALADPTLKQLLELYAGEVTPTKSPSAKAHDRRTSALLLQMFGESTRVRTLNVRDWMRYIAQRRAGGIPRFRADPGNFCQPLKALNPAGDRTIEQDLKFLLAVLNWATRARTKKGALLLEKNPLAGCAVPREKNPRRHVLSENEYQRLTAVARSVHPLFADLLLMAHETGHRIGAILQLAWADVDLKRKEIHWRAENDKMDFDHRTPIVGPLLKMLERRHAERKRFPFLNVFRNELLPLHFAEEWLPYTTAEKWWRQAERRAALPPARGRGWHSLRRKFATDLKATPLADLAKLGGWKDANTIVKCYQAADDTTMRQALDTRRRPPTAKKRGNLPANTP